MVGPHLAHLAAPQPGALPPAVIVDAPLQLGKPPVLTVRETLDVKRLRFYE